MLSKNIILTLLTALVAATTAMPSNTAPNAAPVELAKRACPAGRGYKYQGGGCSISWRGKCHAKCIEVGRKRGCCAGTETSRIDDDGCIFGASTCECTCTRP